MLGCAIALALVIALWVGRSTSAEAEDVKFLVRGVPKALIVQLADLASEFAVNRGEPDGPLSYTHIFFNPKALLTGEEASDGLIGVIANLGVYGDSALAITNFTEMGGLDPQSVTSEILKAQPGSKPRTVELIADEIDGVDRLVAFHVVYEIEDTLVYEYRYRLRVTNALSNLIITSRALADGSEPPGLRSEAHRIAARQVARLIEAKK